jgi:hypothetical protein
MLVCVLISISLDFLTYGSVLGGLGLAALECDAVALVLETLGGDQTLDARSLGVGLGTLLLGLDLTTDDELTDLDHNYVSIGVRLRLNPPQP